MSIRVGLFTLLVVTLTALSAVAAGAAPNAATFQFAPASLALDSGQRGVVELKLMGAQDLIMYQVGLSFNPQVITVERVERVIGAAGQPTPGRTWFPLPLDDDPNVTYISLAPDTIGFGAFSQEGFDTPGVSGDLTLARIHVRAVRGGQSTWRVDMADQNTIVMTRSGQAEGVGAGEGQVVVGDTPYALYLPLLMKNQRLTP